MSQVLQDCLQGAVSKIGASPTSGVGGCGVVMVTEVMYHMI